MSGQSQRLASLDGLRGIAALVVLVHHAMLVIPWGADVYLSDVPAVGIAWFLSYTPLHLFWAGTEAVFLFFVLSGVVLTFPTLRGEMDWGRYYPSRLVRLYLPVAGAVVFAALLGLLFNRNEAIGSLWVRSHPLQYSLTDMLSDATLIGGISHTVSPLWSLVWEVFFSLLLPVYVAAAAKVKPWIVMVASILLIAVGASVGSQVLFYLPMFAIGVALAHAWPSIAKWSEKNALRRWGWAVWLAIFVVCILLTTSRWLVTPINAGLAAGTPTLAVIGVSGLVVVAGFSPLARRILSLRVIVWLGAISFSLYLTHEPILVAFAHFFPTSPRVAAVLGVCVAIPFGWLFYRFVEKPTHRLAKRLARPRELESSETPARDDTAPQA